MASNNSAYCAETAALIVAAGSPGSVAHSFDDIALAAYAVPPLVNNVRNNGPELIAPAEPVETVEVQGPTLDDVFLAVTGHPAEDDGE